MTALNSKRLMSCVGAGHKQNAVLFLSNIGGARQANGFGAV
jgi:hypothetical protein